MPTVIRGSCHYTAPSPLPRTQGHAQSDQPGLFQGVRSTCHVAFSFAIRCSVAHVQALVYFFYKGAWVLPAAGFLVGYGTNWVALKLIFEPAHPKNFGCFTLQVRSPPPILPACWNSVAEPSGMHVHRRSVTRLDTAEERGRVCRGCS